MQDQSWHLLGVDEACGRLRSSPVTGLTSEEAERRFGEHGPNRLPEPAARPAWAVFLDQFRNLLTMVLLAAGVLAGAIGDTSDMVVILAVTLFNAGLGFYQERRAERILGALKDMLAHSARVRRDGAKAEIAADRVVPGDIVLLEGGDRVPADGRLIAAHGLEVDESSLTGESLAVAKGTDALADAEAVLAERSNLAFMNTVVTRGRAEMLVTATGAATEMGRIAALLESTGDAATPLQERLDGLGRRLAAIAGLVVAVILVMGLARGEPLADIVLTAVALAVAAIPEGLPAVVTVTLAIGMFRMARRGAIVKRLAAVETLGSTTVICSDKTGTLTMNRMTAVAGWAAGRRFRVEGEGLDSDGAFLPDDDRGPLPDLAPFLVAAHLCNDARLAPDGKGGRVLVGDATEGALLVLAEKAGIDHAWPRIAELPFDSARKYMLTAHQVEGGWKVLVKGAPDVVLGLCTRIRTEAGERPLDEAGRAVLQAEMERMGGRALRVIALAEADHAVLGEPEAAARDLTLFALVGLMDPPRPGAVEAVRACRQAGIAVKMITGDHAVTAAAIARELGLEGEVVTGAELDRLDDAELAARVDQVAVFARVAPEHKLRIVFALKAKGHVAAMTGDGVNDAAALRGADIGIAMGRAGCDVTREAASMVLTDDDFATVVRAVAEGRTIYDNIVKFVRFQLSTNVGALLTVFAAPLVGLPMPFHAIQILWVNIIMDGPPAMALAFDPPRAGLMNERPRPRDEAILHRRRMARLALYGTTMAAGTLAVFAWATHQGLEPARAQTLAFTTFVLFQFFNVFNARVGHESALNRTALRNGKLWLALGAVLALQAVAVHWGPAQALFHTAALSPADWALATAVASSVLVLDEVRKLATRLVRRR
ncbi:HAD-IC family P-type ATPase [Magnetospirillum sp. UT-4]|uniref:cation-translocating P-type ATPase n=1 Tax=Magnetospirillum sp. UT-4 TaxID=2681467 RepID=UPI00137CC9FD|nr:HAD-IC family P-type ATPase [Magnetospirillum sp. UT-4]CAA7622619.1 Calcium-transporting ATPase [Magnetospirillum sp. UT-4]